MLAVTNFFLRRFRLHFAVAVTAAVLGGAAGVITAPGALQAQDPPPSCEDDRCFRVCWGGSCTGSCHDVPGSGRACDMQGDDCSGSACEET